MRVGGIESIGGIEEVRSSAESLGNLRRASRVLPKNELMPPLRLEIVQEVRVVKGMIKDGSSDLAIHNHVGRWSQSLVARGLV